MADLVVLGFRAESTAQIALDAIDLLESEGLVSLEDLALVTRRENGHIDVKHAHHRVAKGATAGAAAGVVVGALAAIPVFGLAVGAAAGAALNKIGHIGVDERMVERMAGALPPGAGHVLMMVKTADDAKVVERLAPYEPHLVVTTLPDERVAELRRLLDGTGIRRR
ncbi:DUF1269 domain-containing protein [Phytomonospora endophytica]|uniref:Putative membrane protein n=1 Tax=Phytomonospora endophytica TaxID=714109 RepID=A0A841FWT5_9ACTN|nr:DUF1269 domain-containing protein [Phytomonospora endophytica]MBB6039213.1 putative membrane protein [Phytomonospora endophytica]GIG67550.1 membrane protein [Phytomonospora endophytica]